MGNIFKVKGKFRLIPFLISIFIPISGAFLISRVFGDAAKIYYELDRPIFAPPAFIFPIVWIILYILMGFACYRIYMIRDAGENTGTALFYYIIQLILNYFWYVLFFGLRLYGLSFVELIILFIFEIITFIKFIKLDKIAGFLLIPYILWTIFGGVLNFFIWMKNEM